MKLKILRKIKNKIKHNIYFRSRLCHTDEVHVCLYQLFFLLTRKAVDPIHLDVKETHQGKQDLTQQ